MTYYSDETAQEEFKYVLLLLGKQSVKFSFNTYFILNRK